MKRSLKNRIRSVVCMLIVFVLVASGIPFVEGTGPVTARAASRHPACGHRVVEVPKVLEPVELDEDTAEEFNRAALLSPAYKLGEYANLLSDNEKEIYKLCLGAIENYAPYGTDQQTAFDKYGYLMEISASTFSLIQNTADFTTLYNHMTEATVYDHIDKVQFMMCEKTTISLYYRGAKYYAKMAAIAGTADNYSAMNQKLVNARTRLLSSLPLDGKTDEEIELIIHDALIDNVTYFEPYRSVPMQHTCFTAYGALVDGSAVCDGYAQAFAYLLQAKNIDAIVVTGGIGDSEGTAKNNGHAWNRVKIRSDWYEVDTTWDDSDNPQDEEARHEFFNITTNKIENLPNPKNNHLRVDPYLGRYMDQPAATATTYTYDYMKQHHHDSTINTHATSITTNMSSANIKKGETVTATATIVPANATNKYVKWLTSDASVADVDGGVITGNSSGTATITAVAGSNTNVKATIKVTVHVPVTGLALDKNDLSMKVGDSSTLAPTITPADADNKDIIWTSTNPGVASVENGIVSALNSGTTTITATSAENGAITATCKVTVSKKQGTDIVIGTGKSANTYRVLEGAGNTVSYEGCADKKVKSLTIPSEITDENGVKYTVKELGKGALKGRKKLKKLTIPATVTVIRKKAMKDCGKLKKIVFEGDTLEKVESGALSGIAKDAKITIKSSSKSKYKKIVKKLKKAGAKNANFKRKK